MRAAGVGIRARLVEGALPRLAGNMRSDSKPPASLNSTECVGGFSWLVQRTVVPTFTLSTSGLCAPRGDAEDASAIGVARRPGVALRRRARHPGGAGAPAHRALPWPGSATAARRTWRWSTWRGAQPAALGRRAPRLRPGAHRAVPAGAADRAVRARATQYEARQTRPRASPAPAPMVKRQSKPLTLAVPTGLLSR